MENKKAISNKYFSEVDSRRIYSICKELFPLIGNTGDVVDNIDRYVRNPSNPKINKKIEALHLAIEITMNLIFNRHC